MVKKKLSDGEKEILEAQDKVSGEKKNKKNKESKQLKNEKISKSSDLDELSSEKFSDRSKPASEEVLENLEEAISRERIPPQILESQYTKELSHEPVQVIYDQMNSLKQSVEEKGYVNPNEQKQIEYMVGAIEQKLEDQDAGKYSFTESVAMKASLIHKMGASLKGMYKGNISKEDGRMYQTQ
jgi:hypothetical protein